MALVVSVSSADELLFKDGRVVGRSCVRLKDESFEGHVVLFQDNTQRRRAEDLKALEVQLRQALQAKAEFIARASHESVLHTTHFF